MSRHAYTVGAFLLLLALMAFGWKAYTVGIRHEQHKWAAQAAKLSEEYRAKEQALVQAKHDVEVKYAALQKRHAADAAGARTELGRLRDALAAGAATPENPAAVPRADAGASIESELLGACAATLVELAAEADRLAAQLVGLQSYVSGVCLAR